jgi:hypothetical protein
VNGSDVNGRTGDRPPLIDPRSREDLVDQTTALAVRHSDWRPPPDGRADLGSALIGIFGRFAELLVQRVNQVPERSYLAFLNLIGAHPHPPRPARVALTFTLADGSPVDAVVPAGTRVGAAPGAGAEDGGGEVVFETETELVVTRARLAAVVVGDAGADTWSDRTAEATGVTEAAFDAFTGDRPVPHRMHLACDPLLTRGGDKDVTVRLRTGQAELFAGWPVHWSRWNGAEWQPVPAEQDVESSDGTTAWRVRLAGLPRLDPHEVSGVRAGWLRAQLNAPMPAPAEVAPDSIMVGRTARGDAAGVYPFGAGTSPEWFYLRVDQAFAAGGTMRLAVALDRPGVAGLLSTPVQLAWSYKVGTSWVELGRSGSGTGPAQPDAAVQDTTAALTRDGAITFRAPADWPAATHEGRAGRWLRVGVDARSSGPYAVPPRLASLTASGWADPPAVTGIEVSARPTAGPADPPAAFHGTGPLDVTAPFHPFGEQPGRTDICYLAVPDELALPGTALRLDVRLATAGAGDDPRLDWEAWDGTEWCLLDGPTGNPVGYAFTEEATDTGAVEIVTPAGLARTTVNGVDGYWLRIRLVGGDYGRSARYVDGVLEPATFAAPLVAGLTWAPGPRASAPLPPTRCVTGNDFRAVHHPDPAGSIAPFTRGTDADPALHLGFDRPFGARPVSLHLQVEPPAPEEVAAERLAGPAGAARPDLVWEYSGPAGWQPLPVLDGTGALADSGPVRFVGPADLVIREHFGHDRCWLRLRLRGGGFPVPPRLRRVLPNTTWAVAATTVVDEVLGSGTALPDQRLTTAQTPVLPGQRLLVREPVEPAPDELARLVAEEGPDAVTATDEPAEIWVRWHAVGDFHSSGPRDRHYTVDPRTGEIRFGDGLAGRVAPPGRGNIRLTYRTGGGAAGNRPAGAVTGLRSALPHVDSVTNHAPASGGAEWEPVERVRARGSTRLRHRDRAVTAEDVEDLAFASSAAVARVRAVPPAGFDPNNLWLDPDDPQPTPAHAATGAGAVGVVVVPESTADRPVPSLGLLADVRAHLRARCPAGVDLWVVGPEWLEVTVTATVAASSVDAVAGVPARVEAAVGRFLHPLTGGPDGAGWEFGRKPHRSDLFAVVEAVEGVDHVRDLQVAVVPRAGSEELGRRLVALLGRSLREAATAAPEPELTGWLSRALVCSGRHRVTATLRG